jgi:NADH:ubiquinone oxidoreductase subunit 6 (subunit J)
VVFEISCLFFLGLTCYTLINETHTLRMLVWSIVIILLLFVVFFIFNLEFYGLLIILIYVGAICVLFLFIIFTLNSTLFKMESTKYFFFNISQILFYNYILFIIISYGLKFWFLSDVHYLQGINVKNQYVFLVKTYLSENNISELLVETVNTKLGNWLPFENSALPLVGGIFFFKKNFYSAFLLCWLLFYFIVFVSLCLQIYRISKLTIYSKLKIQNSFSQMLIRRKK